MENAIRTKTKKVIRKKIVRPLVIFILLMFFAVMIPMVCVQEFNQMFNNWVKGKEGSYSNMNQAVLAWIDTFKGDIPIGDDYLKKNAVRDYVHLDDDSYLSDKKLTVIEKVKVTSSTSEPNKSGSSNNHENSIPYTLLLSNETKAYRLFWQLPSVVNAYTDIEYNKDILKRVRENFKTKYYGLIDGGKEATNDINSSTKFKYKKKVTVKTTNVRTYYVTKTVTNKKTGEEEEREFGPYSKTTVTDRVIEYPLPYFDRISTLTKDIEFEYETKETTESTSDSEGDDTTSTTTITTTEPVLKNKKIVMHQNKLFSAVKSAFSNDITGADVEYIMELIKEMPDGVAAYNNYYADFNSLYNSNGFDNYFGAESGNGNYKLNGNGILLYPLDHAPINITSGFGMRMHPTLHEYVFHSGIDIAANLNDRVFAADDGKVIFSGSDDINGNYIKVEHKSGLTTAYLHLNQSLVVTGDTVKRGQHIGLAGTTGRSTGVHLHFEIRVNDEPQNPGTYLGLIQDMGVVIPEDLQYKAVNVQKLKAWLDKRNSKLADDPYTMGIINAGQKINVNPLLLFAITGQEQSFVPRNTQSVDRIINNPFNVYHSWYEYNTNIEDSATIAARTIVNLSKGRPEGVNPILWINLRGGEGGYAEDENWWIGVTKFFTQLKAEVGGE